MGTLNISLLDFVKTGKFGSIEVGQTVDSIKVNFPSPDNICDIGDGISVWSYSTFEFHFFEEELMTIWCDWLDLISETKKFSLDLWIFADLDKLTLPYFCFNLDKLHIHYELSETRYTDKELPDNVILKVYGAGVKIYFEDKKELSTSTDNYYLIALGATAY